MPRYANETADKNRWNSQHYESINISVKRAVDENGISDKKRLQELAAASGRSVSRYIIDAVNAYAGEVILSPLDNESKKKKVVNS